MGEFERKKKQMQAQETSMPKIPQQKKPGLLHLQNDAGNRAVSELVESLSGVPEPSLVRTPLGVTATVYFAKNSILLDAANYRVVEQLMSELGYLFEPVVTVDGHASGEGPGAQNQSLSERRRETVMALLTAGLKSKPQIKGAGFGETQPAAPEEAETEGELENQRAQNRRVEITILYRSQMAEESKKPILEPRLESRATSPFDLKIPPPIKQPKVSLGGAFDKEFNKVTDNVLDELGIKKDWMRTLLKKGARAAIDKGAESLLDEAMDQAGLQGNTREAFKKSLEAGLKVEF
jgi:outer membrane protein OmpA-like peptidoglycan-associated protein